MSDIFQDLHVLDAGCGTGNYAKALLDFGVGSVTLLDASRGMLDKAREKLADEIASGRVKEVVETAMPPLPFPDASFDVVMFNLVRINGVLSLFTVLIKRCLFADYANLPEKYFLKEKSLLVI